MSSDRIQGELDAIDLHSTTRDGGVTVHMDAARDATLQITDVDGGGELPDGPLLNIRVSGREGGVSGSAGFFVRVDELRRVLGVDTNE